MKLFLLMTSLLLSACALNGDRQNRAQAKLESPKLKNLTARVDLLEANDGVKVFVNILGLPYGELFQLKVHKGSACEAPGEPLGGLGDMGAVKADAEGVVIIEKKIGHKKGDLFDLVGNTIIIKSAGGQQIACGVIQKQTL